MQQSHGLLAIAKLLVLFYDIRIYVRLLHYVTEKCYQCAYSPPKTVYEKVKQGYGHVSCNLYVFVHCAEQLTTSGPIAYMIYGLNFSEVKEPGTRT